MEQEKWESGTGQKLYVHNREVCKGEPCPIHNPTNHCMRDFPTHWRDDRGIMERICPCGIGHPDPDDRRIRLGQDPGDHGCCGCCRDGHPFSMTPIKKRSSFLDIIRLLYKIVG